MSRRNVSKGIEPIVLLNLAKDVPKKKVDALGIILGFSEADIYGFNKDNASFQTNSDGTHSMLQSWKVSKRAADQIPGLVAALEAVELKFLAEKYFPDHVHPVAGSSSTLPHEERNIATSPVTPTPTSSSSPTPTPTPTNRSRSEYIWVGFCIFMFVIALGSADFFIGGSELWDCVQHMRELGMLGALLWALVVFVSEKFYRQ